MGSWHPAQSSHVRRCCWSASGRDHLQTGQKTLQTLRDCGRPTVRAAEPRPLPSIVCSVKPVTLAVREPLCPSSMLCFVSASTQCAEVSRTPHASGSPSPSLRRAGACPTPCQSRPPLLRAPGREAATRLPTSLCATTRRTAASREPLSPSQRAGGERRVRGDRCEPGVATCLW